MASHQARWQELFTKSRFSCPKLFYKFSSDEQGYKLLFTDLVGLWSEVQEPDDIYQFASDTHTSIDPSQSKTQFSVLLQKLEQSLSKGTNSLFHDPASEDDAVIINTFINLPKPLQPLQWQFRLKPQPSTEMAENILRPSLHEASEAKKKLDSLLDTIKQKDHVLGKLLEKIDNSSIDLSLIFPRISGKSRKGRVTSKDAQTQVAGLGPFNHTAWNERFSTDSTYANFHILGLGNLMAGCERCPKHTTEKHEEWLRNLPTNPPEADTQADTMRPSGEDVDTSSDSESDHFESQSRKRSLNSKSVSVTRQTSHDSNSISIDTQPAKRVKLDRSRSASSQRNAPESDASTASEDDSQDFELPPLPPDSGGKHPRLGQLGAKSKNSAKKPVRPSPSSDSLMGPPPISSSSPVRPKQSSLSSSPLPMAPVSKYDPIKRKDSTNRGSSPTVSSTLNPSTPRKLGRLKSQQTISSPTTPESRSKHDNKSNDTSRETSIPMTPTRRLGRLGASRGPSQAQSQSQLQRQNSNLAVESRNRDKDTGNNSDSDASTASTASDDGAARSLLPRLLPQESSTEFHTQHPQEEPKMPEMTKEGKATYRRQELKRKVGIAEPSGAGTGNGGNTVQAAPRKKRKF